MDWLQIALEIIGGASILVMALEKFAKITPSTKDDYYVSKAKRYVGYAVSLADKLALNPKR